MFQIIMFHCNFCLQTTLNLLSYLDHCNSHQNINNLYFFGYEKCKKTFKTEIHLRNHLQRFHEFNTRNKDKPCYENSANSDGKFVCTVALCLKELDDHDSVI